MNNFPERTASFAQHRQPSRLDQLGRWLSTTRFRRALRSTEWRRAADVGCGYDARLAQQLFERAEERILVDLAVDPALVDHRTTILEGRLPEILGDLEDGACDVVICNNVIEHLWEPQATLGELRRITADGGVCVVNVPSWLGKHALELAAFRLGMSPPDEMEDHKRYYDPRDLWPMLVRAGFKPSAISCRRHKLLLNTIAVCKVA